MNYQQKIVTTIAIKKAALLLTAVFFTLTSMAQDFAKFFSGEWTLNESKSDSIRQFPLSIFGDGDPLRVKTMKIVVHPDFLSMDVTSDSADGSLVRKQEKLILKYKECDPTVVGGPGEKSRAIWSRDGCITVTSVRSFGKNGETVDFRVTGDWQLGNEAKFFSIQVNSISGSRKNTMKLVYDKQMAADYRF